MDYSYIIGGNVMLDKVVYEDGTTGSDEEHIRGPSTFAYSRVKLYTDDVMQCSNVGDDYHKLFDPWVKKNNVETKGFKVVCDRCNHSIMHYKDKSGAMAKPGEYVMNEDEKWLKNDAFQDFGYMKTKPEELEVFTKGKKVKGVYMAQNADKTWWKKFIEIKKRDGFKMMWEVESPWCYPHYLEEIRWICKEGVDIMSCNISEIEQMFDCKGDEECIKNLKTLDVDMVFFRVGERGAYMITKDEVYYASPAPGPIVDPCGCGNSSTGGALYGYCEYGDDPLKVLIYANVASSFNIRQFGIIEDFASIKEEAKALVESEYAKYSAKYHK